MTAKRFEYLGLGEYWDNQEDNELESKEVTELLNALNDENEQLRTKNNAYIQDIEVFKEENTHLKLENEELKDFAQHNYSETKKIINNLQKENEHIKHTIKTMMENERTELGQSVLKQLWEQIE